MEAISFGCGALLIDEDRTATNFMIRDARMKKIIKDDPIIPFTDRVRQIYKDTGISTVLIIGGSGEYLDIADNVYLMKDYVIHNYTGETVLTKQNTYEFFAVNERAVNWKLDRTILKESMEIFKKDETNRIREFVSVNGGEISIGIHSADIKRLDTITSPRQTTAIAFIIRYLFNTQKGNKCCLLHEVTNIYNEIKKNGMESIYSNKFGIDFNMELPAKHDILFTLSRMNNFIYE
jgi:hypothetical protein